MNSLYLATALLTRTNAAGKTDIDTHSFVFFTDSIEAAMGLCVKECFEKSPHKDGWQLHGAPCVTKVGEDLVRQAYAQLPVGVENE